MADESGAVVESEGTPESGADEKSAGLADDLFDTMEETPDLPAEESVHHDEEPEEDEGTPEEPEEAEFDPKTVNLSSVKLEDIPEELRDTYEPLIRRARELESGYTRRVQEIQDKESAAAAAEQEWRDRVQSLATAAQPEADPYEDLTPEQKEGLRIVDERIEARMRQLDEKLASLDTLNHTVNGLVQATTTSQREGIAAQVAEARTAYGDDVNNYGPQIKALMAADNPRTGKPYTVRESYELVSGRTATKSTAMRRKDAEARAQSKVRARTPVGTPVDSDGGDISQSDARDELARLGFER